MYNLNDIFSDVLMCFKTNSRMQRRGLAWVYPKLGFNLGLSISLVAETQFKVVWV